MRIIILKNQAFNSLIYFLCIHSSSSEISVKTLYSLINTSSSHFSIPSCWWLSYSCKCVPLWISQNVHRYSQKCRTFMIWKNLEHLVSQTTFGGIQRQLLKAHKSGTAPVKAGQVGSLSIYGIHKTVYVQQNWASMSCTIRCWNSGTTDLNLL